MHEPYAGLTQQTLQNGLVVNHIFQDHPWIAVEIVVHSGGREDPILRPGRAHFVEHLVGENIPGMTFGSAKKHLDLSGGGANFGGTSYLATTYSFTVPNITRIFRKMLRIFGSMLFHAQFRRNVEQERSVILREFHEGYAFPEELGWEFNVKKALFAGHRLETWSRPIGRPEGFLELKCDDLQRFYDTHYVPSNVSIVVVGGLSISTVLKELGQSPFGVKKRGQRNPMLSPLSHLPVRTSVSQRIVMSQLVNHKVERGKYHAVWAFPASFPREALHVFTAMLNKVLYSEIRERLKLTYGLYADYDWFQDVREFAILGEVAPGSVGDIDRYVQACIDSIPERTALFKRIKIAQVRRLSMTDFSTAGLAEDISASLIADSPVESSCVTRDKIRAITLEQMQDASRFLCQNRKYVTLTCP